MFYLLTFIGLSAIILVHELGHFLAAKFFGLRVDEFGFGLPPRAWGKRIGETVYSLNWLPFGGFVKIFGEEGGENILRSETMAETEPYDISSSFGSQPAGKRAAIILAGVTMNFIFGWFLISAVLMIGTPEGVIITGVAPESPAALSGLKPGDRVLQFPSSLQFTEFIKQNAGNEISFEIRRGEGTLAIKAVPRVSPPPDEGALGVSLTDGGGRAGFFEAVTQGFKSTIALIWLIIVSFSMLIKGLVLGGADLSGVVGPVGIFNVASEAGSLGVVYFLNLLALISINLGVINVMPFPALDGGRFLFILIEKIKGSPLPQKFEQLANGVGFALLIALMVAITFRDISKLV